MKRYISAIAISLIVFLISPLTPARAAATQWKLDPAHSGIYFGIRHIYSTVRGAFDDFKATVDFSPEDLSASRFAFQVAVKSINTGNTKRDAHLNTVDFFDAGNYPRMTFSSTAVKHVRGNQYIVEGRLTVKDVSRNVAVPFTFFGTTVSPFESDTDVAGFEARMTIDRLAYHVGSGKFYDMGVVGKEVNVLITIEATRKR